MKLELTPEQRAVRAELRAFVAEEIVPHADRWDREDKLPSAVRLNAPVPHPASSTRAPSSATPSSNSSNITSAKSARFVVAASFRPIVFCIMR